jgi:hypothetical protein
MIIRGKKFSNSDIELIKRTISDNPTLSRRKLSLLLCQKLHWRQPNGHLKDRACRDVLIRMDQKGIIKIPEPSYELKTQTAGVKQVHFVEPSKEITGKLSDFNTPVFKAVENFPQRQLWNYLVDQYHYKGCRVVVGRHVKYLVYLNQNIIGCFGFADAVLQLKCRDQWIGWDVQKRQAGLHLVINNVRFLILPWVKIKNLASKLLGLSAKIVPQDWQRLYHYRPLLMETFVEKQRFSGASYKAANWTYLGQTRGKGRSGMNYYCHGIIKDVYVYPLITISLLRENLKKSEEML